MLTLNTHIVESEPNNVRLLDYCISLFPQLPSRNSVKKAVKRGELLLNGKRVEQGRWLKLGDKIELIDSEQRPPKAFDLELEILFEDEYLAVVNKPAGIVVSGNQFRTIENALQGNVKPSSAQDALRWPKPVHRLDHPTSGLLIVAKTSGAHISLGKQFERRTIQKTYRAIVKGTPLDQGTINETIDKQTAITNFKLIESVKSLQNKSISLLELKPLTGRTHQLRIHLARVGNPIIGDKIHDNAHETIQHKGLFLAAVGLQFEHPISKEEIQIHIKDPSKFGSLLEREKRRWQKYNNSCIEKS